MNPTQNNAICFVSIHNVLIIFNSLIRKSKNALFLALSTHMCNQSQSQARVHSKRQSVAAMECGSEEQAMQFWKTTDSKLHNCNWHWDFLQESMGQQYQAKSWPWPAKPLMFRILITATTRIGVPKPYAFPTPPRQSAAKFHCHRCFSSMQPFCFWG